jgi:hypothetical protein
MPRFLAQFHCKWSVLTHSHFYNSFVLLLAQAGLRLLEISLSFAELFPPVKSPSHPSNNDAQRLNIACL